MNLLKNPRFEFHSFETHRLGKATSYFSHNVAFWNTDAWGDIRVLREARAPEHIRPGWSAGNLVSIAPGKKLWQFFTLPETGLAHGDRISLQVYGFQERPGALRAHLKLLKVDSDDGTWMPRDFGMADQREFDKFQRGELVVARDYVAETDEVGRVQLTIENAEVVGRVTEGEKATAQDILTIGVQVELENTDARSAVWVYSPSLRQGATSRFQPPPGREMVPYYRYLPRTIQKLWKGEAIHILILGASSAEAGANPPLYFYDEDPTSPAFKQPLADAFSFQPERIGRPELAGYVRGWREYWSFWGRLRLELMRKFNLPVSKILVNGMASGSQTCAFTHPGLEAYCSLSIPPSMAGHPAGKTWQELYPEIFARREGPGPDLVIFGTGDGTPGAVWILEGLIRWIQRHYPDAEFLFSPIDRGGGLVPHVGDLEALTLRYQIPYMDFSRTNCDIYRWTKYASDPHPQAMLHYLWFKQVEQAFECWAAVQPGQAQLHLPERLGIQTYGWEGDIASYPRGHARIHDKTRLILDDTAFISWADARSGVETFVDGVSLPRGGGWIEGANRPQKLLRAGTSGYGALSLGDRHILETAGEAAELVEVACKVCPNRRFIGADSRLWRKGSLRSTPYASEWGAPFGSTQVTLPPESAMELDAVGTDFSVAYVDTPDGGTLRVVVDSVEKLVQPTDQPFAEAAGALETRKAHFMENRKGVLGFPFGLHAIRLEARERPVSVLGIFTYDSRANQTAERRIVAAAAPGERVDFSQPFRARPVVICHAPLQVKVEEIARDHVTFSGAGPGIFEAIGE
ncbi:MAG: hypothetical protein HY321_10780 [Armatimonadetes bacterium]|nr:hypothetical protein [Armatimonadota bacterium]